MTEPEKKLPDEIPLPHENKDDLHKDKKELSEHTNGSKEFNEADKRANFERTQLKLHSLKSNIEESKTEKILAEPDWLGEKEKAPEIDMSESQHGFTASLDTSHVTHFSGIEPNRRIGEKPFHDVRDFGIGAVDSVVSTGRLAGHIVVDSLKLMRHPLREYRRTHDILENNIV